MNDLTSNIQEWAIDRKLDNADPNKQILKLVEEMGELCEGMAKDRLEDVVDAIGDVYVVLTILSMQLGLSVTECVEHAYNDIKDRKGKMVNGVFVKEDDLSN